MNHSRPKDTEAHRKELRNEGTFGVFVLFGDVWVGSVISLVSENLMDPDESECELSLEGVVVEGVAVEAGSWGRIKATMDR